MPVTDQNVLDLVPLTPGAFTWLAQSNADLLAIRMNWPGGYHGIAGEDIFVNEVVAFDSTNDRLYKADSNGANRRYNAVGIALNTAAALQVVKFRILGPHTYVHGQPAGTPLYLSETPGLLTAVAPGTPRRVALAMPSDVIMCAFSSAWAAA